MSESDIKEMTLLKARKYYKTTSCYAYRRLRKALNNLKRIIIFEFIKDFELFKERYFK